VWIVISFLQAVSPQDSISMRVWCDGKPTVTFLELCIASSPFGSKLHRLVTEAQMFWVVTRIRNGCDWKL